MPEDLSDLIRSINKDLKGAATISNISEVKTPYATRLPTGILSMDVALGGGWPAGTMCQLFGADGTGKDMLSNMTIAQQQKIHGDKTNIFWMSFGYKPDIPFMRMCGIQIPYRDHELDEMGIDPSSATEEQRGTQIGNIVFIDVGDAIAMEQPAETLLSAVIRLIKSGKFQLGVVNELGSGETRDNVKKELHEDAKMATWASLMSDFCRKYYSAMRVPLENGEPNKTCILMINPVRANLDSYSSRFTPYTITGGHALKHAKAIDLHIKPGASLKDKTGKIGKEIKWKIAKGKHGIAEGAEGEFNYLFKGGVDCISDLAYVAKAYGVIRNSGPVYYILDYGDKIKGGMDGVISLLKKEKPILEEVREAVLKEACS
jgi:recombination protein RecA